MINQKETFMVIYNGDFYDDTLTKGKEYQVWYLQYN